MFSSTPSPFSPSCLVTVCGFSFASAVNACSSGPCGSESGGAGSSVSEMSRSATDRQHRSQESGGDSRGRRTMTQSAMERMVESSEKETKWVSNDLINITKIYLVVCTNVSCS